MKKFNYLIAILSVLIFSTTLIAKKTTPEETVLELVDSAKKSNWGQVYDCFSKESAIGIEATIKGFMSMMISMAKSNPEAVKNNPQFQQVMVLEKLTGKDFFIKLMQVNPDSKKILGDIENYKVIKREEASNKIILTVKTATREEPISFINENGEWKIDLTEQLKLSPLGGVKSNQKNQSK